MNLLLRGPMMHGMSKATDGVDHVIYHTDSNAIPRDRHRSTGMPSISCWIIAVHMGSVNITLLIIVTPTNEVDTTSDRGCSQTTPRTGQIR